MSKIVLISAVVIIGAFLIYKFVFQKMFGLNKSKDRIRDATPAVTTPAVTRPAVTTPAVTRPAVTRPAVTTPAVTRPAVTTPAVTTPAVTTPAVTRPAVTTPAVTRPESVPRGTGKPPHTCASNEERIEDRTFGGCYPKCENIDGVSTVASNRILPSCEQKCPDGFTDNGAFCLKPASYKRIGRLANRCNSWEEMSGGFCYPICKPGYSGVGNNCRPNCPSGLGVDGGLHCLKKSKERLRKPLRCAENEEMSGNKCYPKCDDVQGVKDIKAKNPGLQFNGIGPECRPKT